MFLCNYNHFQPSCVTLLTICNTLRLDGGVPLTVMDYFYDSSVSTCFQFPIQKFRPCLFSKRDQSILIQGSEEAIKMKVWSMSVWSKCSWHSYCSQPERSGGVDSSIDLQLYCDVFHLSLCPQAIYNIWNIYLWTCCLLSATRLCRRFWEEVTKENITAVTDSVQGSLSCRHSQLVACRTFCICPKLDWHGLSKQEQQRQQC